MKTPHILMVDDHLENLQALHTVLGPNGYKLTDCSSGKEALRLVMQERFDVILLDVRMPEMDGYETARHIQSSPMSATTPLIFITASFTDHESALKGYQVGAADFLIKPFHPETLQKKVEFFLRYSEQVRSEQKKVDSQIETEKVLNLFTELINPLWAVILNVQMMKKFSSKNVDRVLLTLDQKLGYLEASAYRIRDLIVEFKESFTGKNL